MENRSNKILEKQSVSIDSEIKHIQKSIQSIVTNREIISDISRLREQNHVLPNKAVQQALNLEISIYFHYAPEPSSLLLLFKDRGMYDLKDQLHWNEDNIRTSSWYSQMLQGENRFRVLLGGTLQAKETDEPFITFAVSPNESPLFKDVDLILFTFPSSILAKQLSITGELFVTDELGTILLSQVTPELSETGRDKVDDIDQYPFLRSAVIHPSGA